MAKKASEYKAPDPLLSAQQMATSLGIGLTKFYDIVKSGDLVKPVHIGRAARWRSSDRDQFVGRKLAERETGGA